MEFDGAKIREQGVTFAIVVVKPYVLTSPSKEQIRTSFIPFFGNIPIILMAQNSRGIPTYDGRCDIVLTPQEFLGNITKLLKQRKDLNYGKSTCSTKQWTMASKTRKFHKSNQKFQHPERSYFLCS